MPKTTDSKTSESFSFKEEIKNQSYAFVASCLDNAKESIKIIVAQAIDLLFQKVKDEICKRLSV